MRIEPSIYLDALVNDVLSNAGRIVIRQFENARDVMTLAEDVVINCTGLGSKALFGDTELMPLKGQLVVLIPQDEVTYGTNGGVRNSPPGVFVHMMPRRDGIVLGGTSERDVWTTEINEAERTRVVDGHMQLFGSMRTTPR
jgi:glycine/D-amino acid oxidase-like deaminating enzyme